MPEATSGLRDQRHSDRGGDLVVENLVYAFQGERGHEEAFGSRGDAGDGEPWIAAKPQNRTRFARRINNAEADHVVRR